MARPHLPTVLTGASIYLAFALVLWWQLPILPRATWPWNPEWKLHKHWAKRDTLITTQILPGGKWVGPIVFREAKTGRVVKQLLSEEHEIFYPVEVSPGGRWLA